MADTLPVDTTSLAIAALAPSTNGPYMPSLDELIRRAVADRELAQHAAKLHVASIDYERHGLEIEWHHQIDDPAVPYSPYLTAGGQS